jgi:hypothetical protein
MTDGSAQRLGLIWMFDKLKFSIINLPNNYLDVFLKKISVVIHSLLHVHFQNNIIDTVASYRRIYA